MTKRIGEEPRTEEEASITPEQISEQQKGAEKVAFDFEEAFLKKFGLTYTKVNEMMGRIDQKRHGTIKERKDIKLSDVELAYEVLLDLKGRVFSSYPMDESLPGDMTSKNYAKRNIDNPRGGE